MNGKGDKPRKKSVDAKTWEKNWNRIFGNKDKVNDSKTESLKKPNP